LQEKIQMADEAETAARKERELGKRRMMQTSLAEYFVGQDDMKSFADVWTLFFVKSGNVSRRALGLQTFVDAARFTQEHKAAHALTPHKIDESLKRLKEHIVKDVKSDAGEKQQQVCLIVDGWKVTHRIEHAHGVLFSNWTGETVFHTMVADLERHDEGYLTKFLTDVITDIEKTYGVHVSSMVADNAPVMDSTMTAIQKERPMIAHHCSAHWLQLLLKEAFELPAVCECASKSDLIRADFQTKASFKALFDACHAFKRRITRIAKPCATRWNSRLDSMIDVLDLEKEILFLKQQKEWENLCATKGDFDRMREVCEVLAPIANATDVLQSDAAGVLLEADVMTEVEEAVRSFIDDTDDLKSAIARSLVELLQHRNEKANWEENQRSQAVAKFLSIKPSRMPTNEVTAAKRFLMDDGPRFLKFHCHQYKDLGVEEISRPLLAQLRLYIERDVGSYQDDWIDMKDTVDRWALELVGEYAMLARIATMVFAIRASEAAAERAFSEAKSRLPHQRNRLSVERLRDELFVKINTRDREEKKFSRVRVIPDCEPEVRFTKCLPATRLIMEECSQTMTRCFACGELLPEFGEEVCDWWACQLCRCLYCDTCAESNLNDESGLCNECDDPEIQLLKRMPQSKRRKKSD
jgi:hypothetical protein